MTRMCTKPGREANEILRHATRNDLHNTFIKYHADLEWLAFFLTGDENEALACIMDASSLAVGENQIFAEWLERWARRATITAAIAKRKQRILQLGSVYERHPCTHDQHGNLPPETITLLKNSSGIISRLDPLSRFVLILRGVEDYSPKESALILGISRSALDSAYCGALESLALIGRENDCGPGASETSIGVEQSGAC